jgi:hypothetical protein
MGAKPLAQGINLRTLLYPTQLSENLMITMVKKITNIRRLSESGQLAKLDNRLDRLSTPNLHKSRTD